MNLFLGLLISLTIIYLNEFFRFLIRFKKFECIIIYKPNFIKFIMMKIILKRFK